MPVVTLYCRYGFEERGTGTWSAAGRSTFGTAFLTTLDTKIEIIFKKEFNLYSRQMSTTHKADWNIAKRLSVLLCILSYFSCFHTGLTREVVRLQLSY